MRITFFCDLSLFRPYRTIDKLPGFARDGKSCLSPSHLTHARATSDHTLPAPRARGVPSSSLFAKIPPLAVERALLTSVLRRGWNPRVSTACWRVRPAIRGRSQNSHNREPAAARACVRARAGAHTHTHTLMQGSLDLDGATMTFPRRRAGWLGLGRLAGWCGGLKGEGG